MHFRIVHYTVCWPNVTPNAYIMHQGHSLTSLHKFKQQIEMCQHFQSFPDLSLLVTSNSDKYYKTTSATHKQYQHDQLQKHVKSDLRQGCTVGRAVLLVLLLYCTVPGCVRI